MLRAQVELLWDMYREARSAEEDHKAKAPAPALAHAPAVGAASQARRQSHRERGDRTLTLLGGAARQRKIE